MKKNMQRPRQPKLEDLESQVAAWNEHHPVGTRVEVTLDSGGTIKTETGSDAWIVGNHSAVIRVSGISGGFDLNRVKPIS